MARSLVVLTTLATGLLLAAGCGSDPAEPAAATGDDAGAADDGAGVRLVSVEDGVATLADPPADLVVLDVRTPEEFAQGHLEGAVMLDFYRADFAVELDKLDKDVPYLLYCRSGNRSGQTATIMSQLGFSDVADVDGGVVAWGEAGHPLVAG